MHLHRCVSGRSPQSKRSRYTRAPGYFLKPVLRLVQNLNTGSITGIVNSALLLGASCSDADPLTGNAVYVFAGSGIVPDDYDLIGVDPVTSALVNYNGLTGEYEYELGYLSEGDYTLAFTCSAEFEDETDNANVVFLTQDNVSVIADQNTDHPIN